MAFIDEIKLMLHSGKGGDGVVRWRHDKSKELAGPSGGNGGKGGDVYLRAVADIGILANYRSIKSFSAEAGQSGMKNSKHGANGADFFLDVPVGSVITAIGSDEKLELLKAGESIKILSGGKGGLGNERFKSSTNRTPKEFTLGYAGQSGHFLIELLLVVDAGLVG
ncbi:MAG: GTPase ObgE, partial [Patescibacteria group bacterium]